MQELNRGEGEKLTLDGRKKIALTQVESVESFSQQTLKLIVAGTKVTINGERIKITSYNEGTGNLTADGFFNEIKYNYKKIPLAKKIFK